MTTGSSKSQSDIVSDFKTTCMCFTESITLQCGLSAGKQNCFSAVHGVVCSY